jgi:hypothetical protein
MFNYYRFIKSKYSAVEEILASQAKREDLSIRVIDKFDVDDDKDRITVVVMHDVIIDIYRG